MRNPTSELVDAESDPTTSPTAALIEAVFLLWSIATDVPVIAKRLHVDPEIVDHIIAYGCVPPVQLELPWKDLPASPYESPTR